VDELGVNIEWQGPLDDSKIAEQIGIFNNLAASGVSGIVLAPCDDKALAPHVRNAMKRGIPVVIFDSPLDGKQGRDFRNHDRRADHHASCIMVARKWAGRNTCRKSSWAQSSSSQSALITCAIGKEVNAA
jgi:ribose transport system substrate-binding protein